LYFVFIYIVHDAKVQQIFYIASDILIFLHFAAFVVTANCLIISNIPYNPRSKIERGLLYKAMIIRRLAATT